MSEENSHGLAHVLPLWLLGAILGVLILLTLLTVGVGAVELGDLNIFVALGIASVKALLVLLFFMHLKYEKPILAVVVGSALLIVALFIALAMADTAEYNPEMERLEKRIQTVQ